MRLRQRLTTKALQARLPRRTVRLRLTFVYGGLFLVSGAVLLVITDVLWGNETNSESTVPLTAAWRHILRGLPPTKLAGGHIAHVTTPPLHPPFWQRLGFTHEQVLLVKGQLLLVTTQQHGTDLHQLILFSAIAIAIMAILAIVLGWLMAGRVLRPVRTITTAARDISVKNLHERLRLDGPDDELKELGDTFDGLLERLEGSFQAQRLFVANASHELRTPLATMRASLDVAMAKPAPLPQQTVALAGRLREELDQVDRLLRELARPRPCAAWSPLRRSDALARPSRLRRDRASRVGESRRYIFMSSRRAASTRWVTGSETLLSRMVENVIDNAVKHNEQGGWVRTRTEFDGACVRLIVENGGPVVDEGNVEELAQPFRRLGAERTGSDTSSGLGLSIVAAVAEAHGGTLVLRALSGGGLQVVIELPIAVRTLAGAPA